MQDSQGPSRMWRFFTVLWAVVGLSFSKPAHAGFFDYWLSGDLGADMFALVGISEDDLVEIVIDVEDAANDLARKADNTVKELKGECFEGVTFMDDIDAVAGELEFYWEYKGVMTEEFLDALADDFTSGRARDRIIAYGKGLGEGAYEAGKETLFLASDGIAYGVLYTFTDGDEEHLEFRSQIVRAYDQAAESGVYHGEVTGQLLEGLIGIPGQVLEDLENDNPEGVGFTIGSFLPPAKLVKLGTKASKTGITQAGQATTTALNQLGRVGNRAAQQAPKVRIVTRTGTHSLPGRVLGEYNALKAHPRLGKVRGEGGPTQTPQATFSGYRITDVELNEPMTIYRYHNNGAPGRFWDPQTRTWTESSGARWDGAFWSLGEPVGTGVARVDSAVLPSWGNTMTHRTTVILPKGTVISVGEAANQGGTFVGGGSQLIVKGGIKRIVEQGAKAITVPVVPTP